MDYIVRRCLLRGEPPLSGLEDAATSMTIVVLAQESARRNVAVEVE
jgi:hypothetical protein